MYCGEAKKISIQSHASKLQTHTQIGGNKMYVVYKYLWLWENMKYTTMVTKAGNPSAKHHKIGSKYLPLGSKILATDNTKYYKEYKYRHINSTLCASRLSMCVCVCVWRVSNIMKALKTK